MRHNPDVQPRDLDIGKDADQTPVIIPDRDLRHGDAEAIRRACGKKAPVHGFPWWLMRLTAPFAAFPREPRRYGAPDGPHRVGTH